MSGKENLKKFCGIILDLTLKKRVMKRNNPDCQSGGNSLIKLSTKS